MMRAYTLTILQKLAKSDKPLEDKDIIAWVNEKVLILSLVNVNRDSFILQSILPSNEMKFLFCFLFILAPIRQQDLQNL